MAMIATISLVLFLASWIGLFDPSTCSETQGTDWASCEAIAQERVVASIIFGIITVVGFAVSINWRPKSRL